MGWIRTLLCLLALMGMMPARAADASKEALNAVNRAGEQRMLSQRIVKGYAQLGMGVQPQQARAIVEDSVVRFEANLKWLDAFEATPRSSLRGMRSRWQALRSAIKAKPTLASARQANRRGEAVLIGAERMTRLLQNVLNTEASHVVNLAGRQRMLSQRLTKAYMLTSWGDVSPALREELDTAMHEFSLTLDLFSARAGNSAAINAELEEQTRQWNWLKTAVATEGAVNYRLIVAEASESLLLSAERLTRLYEAAGAEQAKPVP